MNSEREIVDFFESVRRKKQGMQGQDFNTLPDISLSELKRLASFLAYDTTMLSLRDTSKRCVWHVAMPKSGSTWVTKVMEKYLVGRGWKAGWPCHTGGRFQDLSMPEFYRQKLLDDDIFLMHMHVLPNEWNVSFARQLNAKVILQIRNIQDVLVSLVDHYEKEKSLLPFVSVDPKLWEMFSANEKIDFVVEQIGPWYIKFWASWFFFIDNKSTLDVELVRYESLVDDRQTVFSKIADFCEGEYLIEREFDYTGFTRFNKGVVGRGGDISQQSICKLKRMTEMYPDVDFSYMGL
ncbi:sulfotransferase domain-containing protein [Pokkaliibacter sp. MBI-7]|uniref:sulfotransferase domain-containing protein n=1 Tax=Pokkaliibacter sp. MBI-7 TaxID=3040600 RepID=UPI0024476A03|nr:sulfotransferase domain-containing protein [Pokkaliibacter sp. MBI-7]MDH2431280.1 sulfotransferase domain-containing protein [Pokkaliibacter sp. MBI-7]